jgi:hypothetical protein
VSDIVAPLPDTANIARTALYRVLSVPFDRCLIVGIEVLL